MSAASTRIAWGLAGTTDEVGEALVMEAIDAAGTDAGAAPSFSPSWRSTDPCTSPAAGSWPT